MAQLPLLKMIPTSKRCQRIVGKEKDFKHLRCNQKGYAIVAGSNLPLCWRHFNEVKIKEQAITDQWLNKEQGDE